MRATTACARSEGGPTDARVAGAALLTHPDMKELPVRRAPRTLAVTLTVLLLPVALAQSARAADHRGGAAIVAHRSRVTTRAPTPAQRDALANALARAGFPKAGWRMAHVAVSVNPAGFAIATPVARNPANQGNGVAIFSEHAGHWRVIAQGSTFERPVVGVPEAVLKALIAVPGEGNPT